VKMKNRILLVLLALVFVLGLGLVACTGEEEQVGPSNDKVYIFAARPLTGTLESIGDYAFGPIMDFWQDKVNRAGGINVGGTIGTVPIDLTIVDDTSDIGVMSSLLTAAISSDDYHFVFPPCSTSFLQAAAGICTGAHYFLLGAEGGCTTIQDQLTNYKYLFANLNFSTWGQMASLFEILRNYQTTDGAPDPMNVYIMYIGDLHGFEYRDAFTTAANTTPNTGHFNIVGTSSVPLDATSVLTQLNAAKAANATLLCSFTYPPASMLTVSEAIDNDINFDAMIVGPGLNFEFMLLPFVGGIDCNLDLQGVMNFATWNEASGGNATAQFAADLSAFFGQPCGTTVYNTTRGINGVCPVPMGRFIIDWWGAMPYYAGVECFQEAIEDTHSLSNDNIRNEFATRTSGSPFTTTFGPAWYVQGDGTTAPGSASGGLLVKSFNDGFIGQWQYAANTTVIPSPFFEGMNATGCGSNYPGWMIDELIDVGTGTAAGIYPKPDWGNRTWIP
jgi:ABC-type branched-subunit amino acid transport system substrate-binding protein